MKTFFFDFVFIFTLESGVAEEVQGLEGLHVVVGVGGRVVGL